MDEINDVTPDIKNKCICPKCPTFPSKYPDERLYCGVGNSKSKIDYWGCICPTCPVAHSHALIGGYYCSRGKAQKSNGKK